MTQSQGRALLIAAAVVALLAGVGVSYWWRSASAPDTTEPNLADFSLPDIQGQTRWLSEWQGKTVVLNFWATWCGPCLEEIPLLLKAQKRYQDKGVQVIGVAIDHRDAVEEFARKFRISYPLLLAEETGIDMMIQYSNTKGSLPYTVIIGTDGAVKAKKLGAYVPGELESTLDPLLDATPATSPSK